LRESLTAVAPIFASKKYFMSDEFSLVDCCLAPILWRTDALNIDLPRTRQTQALFDYMDRVFSREAFQQSLTELEKEMRPDAVVNTA